MNNLEKRRLLLDSFGVSSEDQVKNSNRYILLYEETEEMQMGVCGSPDCENPMSSISFIGKLDKKEIFKQKNWKGFCRRHKKPVLGIDDLVIGSSARRSSIANGKKLHSSISDAVFHHQHNRSKE